MRRHLLVLGAQTSNDHWLSMHTGSQSRGRFSYQPIAVQAISI